MFLYLDESGDLGWTSKGASKKFVITILVCQNEKSRKSIRNAIRKTVKNKFNKKKRKTKKELKGTNTEISIKKYFLKNIREDDWQLYTLVINKSKVNKNLRTKVGKKKLYNFMAKIIINKLNFAKTEDIIQLVVDKCKNRAEIIDFNNYISNHIKTLLPLNIPVDIFHQDSQNLEELQAVDLFCYGVYRKYELNDTEWYNCYNEKIFYETEYL